MKQTTSSSESLTLLLRTLRLPTFAAMHSEAAAKAEREGWAYDRFLHYLSEQEIAERESRRRERLLKQSDLPRDKTLDLLELDRLPVKVKRQLPSLLNGAFVERGENVLCFGLPGRGKTHVACAIGRELIARDYRVLFIPTFKLVQRLLKAKQELALESELRKLDKFDVVILDDIGYVQQDRDEMEVLFTFLGERYERKSVIITSNLVFSQWDRIFKDPLTTSAAIDRLVHHATIFEMTGKSSYRADEAKSRNKEEAGKQKGKR